MRFAEKGESLYSHYRTETVTLAHGKWGESLKRHCGKTAVDVPTKDTIRRRGHVFTYDVITKETELMMGSLAKANRHFFRDLLQKTLLNSYVNFIVGKDSYGINVLFFSYSFHDIRKKRLPDWDNRAFYDSAKKIQKKFPGLFEFEKRLFWYDKTTKTERGTELFVRFDLRMAERLMLPLPGIKARMRDWLDIQRMGMEAYTGSLFEGEEGKKTYSDESEKVLKEVLEEHSDVFSMRAPKNGKVTAIWGKSCHLIDSLYKGTFGAAHTPYFVPPTILDNGNYDISGWKDNLRRVAGDWNAVRNLIEKSLSNFKEARDSGECLPHNKKPLLRIKSVADFLLQRADRFTPKDSSHFIWCMNPPKKRWEKAIEGEARRELSEFKRTQDARMLGAVQSLMSGADIETDDHESIIAILRLARDLKAYERANAEFYESLRVVRDDNDNMYIRTPALLVRYGKWLSDKMDASPDFSVNPRGCFTLSAMFEKNVPLRWFFKDIQREFDCDFTFRRA